MACRHTPILVLSSTSSIIIFISLNFDSSVFPCPAMFSITTVTLVVSLCALFMFSDISLQAVLMGNLPTLLPGCILHMGISSCSHSTNSSRNRLYDLAAFSLSDCARRTARRKRVENYASDSERSSSVHFIEPDCAVDMEESDEYPRDKSIQVRIPHILTGLFCMGIFVLFIFLIKLALRSLTDNTEEEEKKGDRNIIEGIHKLINEYSDAKKAQPKKKIEDISILRGMVLGSFGFSQ